MFQGVDGDDNYLLFGFRRVRESNVRSTHYVFSFFILDLFVFSLDILLSPPCPLLPKGNRYNNTPLVTMECWLITEERKEVSSLPSVHPLSFRFRAES
jgi:hypothetical protein